MNKLCACMINVFFVMTLLGMEGENLPKVGLASDPLPIKNEKKFLGVNDLCEPNTIYSNGAECSPCQYFVFGALASRYSQSSSPNYSTK